MRPQGLRVAAALLVGACLAWGPQASAQALGGAFSSGSIGGGQGYRAANGSLARRSGAVCAPAGDLSAGSWLELGDCLALEPAQAPTAAGTLTLNDQNCASADVAIIDGPVTIGASWDPTAYFTNTADSRHAIVIVKGNLTVSSGEVFTPPVRKLSWYLHVTGDTTLTGDASMTARGANHSATGSDLAACAMRIATGTYSSVVNPEIPAAGGAGAPGVDTFGAGGTGAAGTGGGLGGGGSGAVVGGPGDFSGSGAAATSYSGGAASGGSRGDGTGVITADAGLRGGAGSNGLAVGPNHRGAGGGSGTPPGAGQVTGDGTAEPGGAGAGGTGILIARGACSGAGAFSSNGRNGGAAEGFSHGTGGGASGGGHATALCGSGTLTVAANGGAGGVSSGTATSRSGGAGGIGTARVLSLGGS